MHLAVIRKGTQLEASKEEFDSLKKDIESPHCMKTTDSETRYKRIWFGINASVTISPGSGFLHKAGVGRFVIPRILFWIAGGLVAGVSPILLIFFRPL